MPALPGSNRGRPFSDTWAWLSEMGWVGRSALPSMMHHVIEATISVATLADYSWVQVWPYLSLTEERGVHYRQTIDDPQ
jgi:hypothetical protein